MKALMVAVFAVGCAPTKMETPMVRPVGEDLLALVPAGADLIVDVDLEQVRGWGATRRLLEAMPDAMRERLAGAGFDPVSGADALVLAVSAMGSDAPQVTAVVRGDLDDAPVRGRLGGKIEETEYHGVTVLEGAEGAFAKIAPKLRVFGSRIDVRRVIDLSRDGGESVHGQAGLMAAYARAPTARLGRPAVILALVPTEVVRDRLRKEGMPGIEPAWYALSLAVGDGFDVVIVAGLRGEREAHDQARALKEEIQKWRDRPLVRLLGLRPFVDGIAVRSRETEMRLALRLPQPEVDRLLTRLEALSVRAREGAAGTRSRERAP